MAQKRSDTSRLHFEWLVERRSTNQRSSVAIYGLIEQHQTALTQRPALQLVAQDLAAIAFSLWRAVFLSDLTGELGEQLGDVISFLRNLVAHNAVLYQTDFNAREWAFIYYLENARTRLEKISRTHSAILSAIWLDQDALSPKDAWSNAQSALDIAIANFAKVLDDHDPA